MKTIASTLVLLACLSITAHAEQKPIVLHFKSVGTLMLVDVRVNGELKSLIFDTGAQRSTLDTRTQQDRIFVGVLTIDKNVFFNTEFILTNQHDMFKVLGQGDGVLGEDFLRRFKSYSIDYKDSTITLQE